MPISDEDIGILIQSAGVEIASTQRPPSEHVAAIERYFSGLERRSDSGFEVYKTEAFVGDDPSTYHVRNITSLGTFDLTPATGKLTVPQEGGEPAEIQFFSAADETASLVSATIRFTERRLAFVKKKNAALGRVSHRR